jgi:hypothetical protein
MRSAVLIFVLIAAPAAAQVPVWSEVQQAEGIYAINFGVPDTDDAPFFMSCTQTGDTVEISWHADIDKPAGMQTGPDGMRARLEDQAVEIRFANGDNASSEKLKAAFQPEEMYGAIFVEMHVPKNAPLLQKFRSSSDAALVVAGGEPQTLDLKGADASIGKLLAACGG